MEIHTQSHTQNEAASECLQPTTLLDYIAESFNISIRSYTVVTQPASTTSHHPVTSHVRPSVPSQATTFHPAPHHHIPHDHSPLTAATLPHQHALLDTHSSSAPVGSAAVVCITAYRMSPVFLRVFTDPRRALRETHS